MMEKMKSSISRPLAGNGVLWGMFVSTFLMLLIVERRIFMRYVDEVDMQLLILGITFGIAFISIWLSRFISSRLLAWTIFTSVVVAALLWLIVFFNLKAIELQYDNNDMAWASYLQIAMFSIQVGILPILLIEWTRRCQRSHVGGQESRANEASLALIALVVGGFVACTSGFLSVFGNQWSVLAGCLANLVSAIFILVIHSMNLVVHPGHRDEQGQGTSDTNLFFRDVMITIVIGIPGYSMMARDEFLFQTLILTGSSLAIFGVLHYIIAHVRKKPGALAVLEGIVIALLIASTCMMMYLYMHWMTVDLVAGLPEFIVGFGLGYFWTRVIHVGEGIPYPKAFPSIVRKGAGKDFTNKLASFLLVLLLGISVAIAISVTSSESVQYIYPAALVLAGVDVLLYAISALKYKG